MKQKNVKFLDFLDSFCIGTLVITMIIAFILSVCFVISDYFGIGGYYFVESVFMAFLGTIMLCIVVGIVLVILLLTGPLEPESEEKYEQ